MAYAGLAVMRFTNLLIAVSFSCPERKSDFLLSKQTNCDTNCLEQSMEHLNAKSDTCKVKGCSGKFHRILLHYVKEAKNKPFSSQKSSFSKSEALLLAQRPTLGLIIQTPTLFLCIVPVIINCIGKELKTQAFLDQGFIHTFCHKDKGLDCFEIEGFYEKLYIQTLHGITKKSTHCFL